MKRSAVTSSNPGRIRWIQIAAHFEGATLLFLLIVAVPVKHLAGFPAIVSVVGPIHGIAFLFYLWVVATAASGGEWKGGEIVRLLLAAVVPFGPFLNAKLMERKAAALELASQRRFLS
jgi:integral membrane protein